jgi:Cytochrome c
LQDFSFHSIDEQEKASVRLPLKHPLLFAVLLLAGCSDEQPVPLNGTVELGVAAINTLGCGACHDVPGISWPKTNVGPPLHNYGNQTFIAGVVPNTPENLNAFIQNAIQFVPEGAMPPIAMTEQQAAEIASFLLSLREEG